MNMTWLMRRPVPRHIHFHGSSPLPISAVRMAERKVSACSWPSPRTSRYQEVCEREVPGSVGYYQLPCLTHIYKKRKCFCTCILPCSMWSDKQYWTAMSLPLECSACAERRVVMVPGAWTGSVFRGSAILPMLRAGHKPCKSQPSEVPAVH